MSRYLNFILTLLLFLFCLSNVDFHGKTTPDTFDYLDVSKNWLNSYKIQVRPALYPLVLFISKKISSSYAPVIWVQLITYVTSFYFVIAFIVPKIVSTKKIKLLCSFAVFLSFMVPQTISLLSYILPETLPLLLVLATIYYTFSHINNAHSFTTLSLAPVFAFLLKPVWIILLLFPALKLFIVKSTNKREVPRQNPIQETKLALFTFCIAVAVIGAYSIIVKNNAPEKPGGSHIDMDINLSLLRGGWVENTQGSIFYEYLEQNHRIYFEEVKTKRINQLSPEEEFIKFSQVKDSIPTEIRSDRHFWRKSLKHSENLFPFLLHKVSLFPKFFLTSASNSNVRLLKSESFLDYIYQGTFNRIHKWLIIPIYLISVVLLFTVKLTDVSFRFFLTCFFLIVTYASVTVLVTYQISHYLRLRGVIEPVILFVPLLFFGVLIDNYLKNNQKQP